MLELIVQLSDSTLRLGAPLILAALGGLWSERAGVVDLGIEGKMLVGAFAGAVIGALTGSNWLGLAAAMAAAVLLGLVHGFACISQRGNQVVSGVALNILALGLTAVLAIAWYRQGGQTPPLPGSARFLPVLGGHTLLIWLALLLVPVTWWVIERTRFGLRLRAVGDAPNAVDTAGISVARLRYQALLLSGACCGLAGASLSMAQSAQFITGMTAGKGFLALAALILGKWKPVPTLFACLLFAVTDAVQTRLQGVGGVPVQFIQMLPYVATVVLLAGFVGRTEPPRAIGVPYVKER